MNGKLHKYNTKRRVLTVLSRWTASSVQTLATAMFLKRKELHFFNEVGYTEKRGEHCPFNLKLLETCACDFQDTYGKFGNRSNFFSLLLINTFLDFNENSCTVDLLRYISPETIDEMAAFARLKIIE